VTGYRWPRYNELEAVDSSYKLALDYGLVELAPAGGQHAGDIYGWWPMWLSPPLNATYPSHSPRRWDERRISSGYPSEGWFGTRSGYWPRSCGSNVGGYYYWGEGYWSIGLGCITAGGNSGGPIWAIR